MAAKSGSESAACTPAKIQLQISYGEETKEDHEGAGDAFPRGQAESQAHHAKSSQHPAVSATAWKVNDLAKVAAEILGEHDVQLALIALVAACIAGLVYLFKRK